MIVYRDVVRTVATDSFIHALHRLARDHRATSFLVEVGRLEQAAVDASSAERDDTGAVERALRSASLAAGRALTAATLGQSRQAMAAALDRVDSVRAHLPAALELREPEGYAHYALDPLAYAEAARSYSRWAGARCSRAVVVGIRSIGTSLSAVVAVTLNTAASATVRPRGETGERHIRASERLSALVREAVEAGGDALLVDEGPGVTGETFECAARWLRRIGVPASRIVLFPSHDGAMPLAPESRRRWFRSTLRFPPPVADERMTRIAERRGWAPPIDLSAGSWRRKVPGAEELPAVPHFERVKARVPGDTGLGHMLRYAGLGASLDRWLHRAGVLGELVPGPVEPTGSGFIVRPWVDGAPVARRRELPGDLAAAMVSYVGARADRLATGEPVDRDWWVRLLLENGAESGAPSAALACAARALERLPQREAVIPDGRLQPWEWIRTPAGTLRKVDAMDHGDGLRVPGPTDGAWDAAGATIELGLHGPDARAFLHAASRERGMPAGEEENVLSPRALAAYRPVYAAACYGDAELAARESSDAEDRVRLRCEAAFYAAALEAALIEGLS